VNPKILEHYITALVPRLTRHPNRREDSAEDNGVQNGEYDEEDDGNYGSSATIDVEILQSISKRVHYGQILFFSTPEMEPIIQYISRQVRVGIQIWIVSFDVHTSDPRSRSGCT
jgi:hypothetical protein